MEYVIRYGRKIETHQLDDEGSKMTDETTIADYKTVDTRQKFEIRVRVQNEQQELAEYLKFRDETRNMRNCGFEIEHNRKADSEGGYYVVKKYVIRHDE